MAFVKGGFLTLWPSARQAEDLAGEAHIKQVGVLKSVWQEGGSRLGLFGQSEGVGPFLYGMSISWAGWFQPASALLCSFCSLSSVSQTLLGSRCLCCSLPSRHVSSDAKGLSSFALWDDAA